MNQHEIILKEIRETEEQIRKLVEDNKDVIAKYTEYMDQLKKLNSKIDELEYKLKYQCGIY